MRELIELTDLSELPRLTKVLQGLLRERVLFLFVGEVGSGKTTTVTELCKVLGMGEAASPSFAIHHRYENVQGDSLDHVDLYRLKSEDDLESTGFWDLFVQEKGWIVVEWADKIDPDFWPIYWPTYLVEFEKHEGERRTVRISDF